MSLTADQTVEALRAAGEPTRLRILSLLAGEELSVMEMSRILDQSQPRVSRHLKLMTDAGLIERFPDGARVYYRLSHDAHARRLIDTVLDILADDAGEADHRRLDEVRKDRAQSAESYFEQIGLLELAKEGFARIGTDIVEPGTRLGQGLTKEAAEAMGLKPGTAVAAGMIDAHAGGIGTVGIGGKPAENLAYVFGTSSCTMTSTTEPVFVPGVWGPYYSAMVPGMWLNEGGQSAAGAAIDQLLSFHPAAAEATARSQAEGKSLPAFMAEQAALKIANASEAVDLAAGLHVVPEFLGNRAPFADPHARAVIAGLGMERDFDSLIALYIAGLCGIGYGLRQIIETQAKAGASVERVVISGGAGASPLVRQILADACGKPVVAPAAEEPVLLGSAILGSVAAGVFLGVRDAMAALLRAAELYEPSGDVAYTHERRYEAFLMLQDVSRTIRSA